MMTATSAQMNPVFHQRNASDHGAVYCNMLSIAGGDASAAEVLPGSGGPDEPDPVQASLVHHDRAVPHEVRVEQQRARHGGRAHHHSHRLR